MMNNDVDVVSAEEWAMLEAIDRAVVESRTSNRQVVVAPSPLPVAPSPPPVTGVPSSSFYSNARSNVPVRVETPSRGQQTQPHPMIRNPYLSPPPPPPPRAVPLSATPDDACHIYGDVKMVMSSRSLCTIEGPYNEKLNAMYKSSGGTFDPIIKKWVLPMTNVESLGV